MNVKNTSYDESVDTNKLPISSRSIFKTVYVLCQLQKVRKTLVKTQIEILSLSFN